MVSGEDIPGGLWSREEYQRAIAKICAVYWGSHGCDLERGHDGPHLCDCAVSDWKQYEAEGGYVDDEGATNVGAPPYYGPDTKFYGEDVPGYRETWEAEYGPMPHP